MKYFNCRGKFHCTGLKIEVRVVVGEDLESLFPIVAVWWRTALLTAWPLLTMFFCLKSDVNLPGPVKIFLGRTQGAPRITRRISIARACRLRELKCRRNPSHEGQARPGSRHDLADFGNWPKRIQDATVVLATRTECGEGPFPTGICLSISSHRPGCEWDSDEL